MDKKIHTVNKHRNFSLARKIYASMQNISLLEGRAKQASALNKWSGDNFIDSGTLPLPNNKIKVEKRVAAAIAVRVCLAAGANPPAASLLDLYPRARCRRRGSVREFPADKR